MDIYNLADELLDWPAEDLENLARILSVNSMDTDICDRILEKIRWLYHSKTKAKVGNSLASLRNRVLSQEPSDLEMSNDRLYPIPSYENLVTELSVKLGVSEKDASITELETYLSHTVIIEALHKMKPKQRMEFFSKSIDIDEISKNTGINGNGLVGPLSTMGILGAAQLSGFGVYLTATTALGFATSAVGVTLPFAVYTGMTSTIAVIIGPVGWLAAGLWGTWKLLQPEWKKLVPVVLYIASARSRHILYKSTTKAA